MKLFTLGLFTFSLLICTLLNTSTAQEKEANSADTKEIDHQVRIYLDDESVIVGKIESIEELEFNSSVGKFNLSFEKLVGIELQTDKTKSRLTLNNGDRITGELIGEKIKVTAVWGKVEIELANVEQIIVKNLPDSFQLIPTEITSRSEKGTSSRRTVDRLVRTNARNNRSVEMRAFGRSSIPLPSSTKPGIGGDSPTARPLDEAVPRRGGPENDDLHSTRSKNIETDLKSSSSSSALAPVIDIPPPPKPKTSASQPGSPKKTSDK